MGDPNWQEVLLLAAGVWEQNNRRTVEELIKAMLDAPDVTEGLLAHNVLLAAAALAELEHPPAPLVTRSGHELVAAYTRTDEEPFCRVKGASGEGVWPFAPHGRGPRPRGRRAGQGVAGEWGGRGRGGMCV